MRSFVLDASVALAWFVDNPIASFAQRVREKFRNGDQAIVPALWHLEVANGLLVAERRGTVSAADVDAASEQIGFLLGTTIETAADLASVKQSLETARAYQLSAYDAVYVDLSRRQRLPLATLDKRLFAAASKAGVDTIR